MCKSTSINLSCVDPYWWEKKVKTRFALTQCWPGWFNDILRTSSEYPVEPNDGYIFSPPELKSCLCGHQLIAGRLCPEGKATLQEMQQGRFLAVTAQVRHFVID